MLTIDFQTHNARSREIWKAYNEGKPIRVPVTIYADARNWMHEKGENVRGVTLSDYLQDKDLMFECQVKAQEWIRHNILSDDGMGYPEEEGWSVIVDFQNYLEPVWFGGEVTYGLEPHALAFLNDGNKRLVFDKGIPGAFEGIGGKVKEYYDYFGEKLENYSYKGIPVKNVRMPYNMAGSDGPFTIACGIRGMENFINDLLSDPDYAHELLDFITTAIINRIKKVREYTGQKPAGFGIADDAIVLLSPALYSEFVLPCHKKIYEALTPENGARSMHLCGNAQPFFPILEKELAIKSFDTGFPIKFEQLYDALSPDVQIIGGPQVALLKFGTRAQVKEEVKRILTSGVMEKSKRFVLREGNALSPGTPPENIKAMYEACEEYGYY